MKHQDKEKLIWVAVAVVVILCIFSVGKFINPAPVPEVKVNRMASAVTKVTRLAENVVRFGKTSDAVLIDEVKKKDAGSLTEFQGYYITAKEFAVRDKKYAAVLVCSGQNGEALLEDLSCTAKMDIKHYPNKVPCKFAVDDTKLAEVCGKK